VVLHEIDKNLERLGTQRDLFGAAAQKAAVEIQGEVAKQVLAVEPVGGMWSKASQRKLLEGFDEFLINLSSWHHDFNRCSRLIFQLQPNPANPGGSR
jgi:hypothetical protein